MHNLTPKLKTVVASAAVAAGTTDVQTTTIDTMGFQAIRWVALFGALTATQVTSIKAEMSDASDMSGAVDIEGSSVGPLADGDSGKALILEVYRPQKRYVRLVVDRGTANAVVNGVIAELSGASHTPVDKDATVVAAEVLNSPDGGTA